jgi:hypothetical protein
LNRFQPTARPGAMRRVATALLLLAAVVAVAASILNAQPTPTTPATGPVFPFAYESLQLENGFNSDIYRKLVLQERGVQYLDGSFNLVRDRFSSRFKPW